MELISLTKNNAAFASGCGYEYQRYVFLLACMELEKNGYVTFELNEDVEIGSLKSDLPHIVIQVKEKAAPIQLKDVLLEINKAWTYLTSLCDKNINFWYITTQIDKLESPPLNALMPNKTGIEIWNKPECKEELKILADILSNTTTTSPELREFIDREREMLNVIKDSLICKVRFFCQFPYLKKLQEEIEKSLKLLLEKNGYQYSNVQGLVASLKNKIDILMDEANRQKKKSYNLSYDEFQKLICENITPPDSYTTSGDGDEKIVLVNVKDNVSDIGLIKITQSLFENEQRIMNEIKEISEDFTESYYLRLGTFLLKIIHVRTGKTLEEHLKDINDTNQRRLNCFVLADQLINDIQNAKIQDREAINKRAVEFLGQLDIFYNRGIK